MNIERACAPQCPYCGHIERDAWEIDFGPGFDGDKIHTCNACDRNYFLSRHVAVSYSSRPLIDLAPEPQKDRG